MNELRPLLKEGADPLALELLREARALGPSEAAISRAMTTIVGAATATVGASTAVTAGKAGISASHPLLFAKWVLIGALGGIATIGVADWAARARVPGESTLAAAPTSAPLAAELGANAGGLERNPTRANESPTSNFGSLPPHAAARAREPHDLAASSSSEHGSDAPIGLGQEIGLIDHARAALDRGDPLRALALLDEYRRRAPAGRLAPEARYLRVRALLESGNRSAGERAGREFLDSNPTSPHAKQVRELVAPTPSAKYP
jgi:hypothetical protein